MPKKHSRVVSSRREKRMSPFPPSNSQSGDNESPVPTTCTASADMKEWEEVKCPVCFDTPHNAVLLLCSSHDRGCRPYMCNTGHRHSNCLDCFREAFAAKSPSSRTAATTSRGNSHSAIRGDGRDHNSTVGIGQEILHHVDREREDKKVLSCPLCRGKIKGWTIVEEARRFMDTKPRVCALESCGFSGTYRELRSHARVEHPQACPSAVDPDREHSWRTLEQQYHLADMVASRYFVADGSNGEWDLGLTPDEDYWSFLTIHLLGLLHPRSGAGRLSPLNRAGRWTGGVRRRRMSYSNFERLAGFGNEGGTQGGASSSHGGGLDLISL